MKPATHPKITVTGIVAGVVINTAGLILLATTGHAGVLFFGMVVCFVVWIDIIVDHNRRLPSFLPEEGESSNESLGTLANTPAKS